MTKEQFLNGDLFKLSTHGSCFRLSDDKTSINSCFVSIFGNIVDVSFEVHVDFVGRVAIQTARMVLTKDVKQKIKYSDMILVDIAKEQDDKLKAKARIDAKMDARAKEKKIEKMKEEMGFRR